MSKQGRVSTYQGSGRVLAFAFLVLGGAIGGILVGMVALCWRLPDAFDNIFGYSPATLPFFASELGVRLSSPLSLRGIGNGFIGLWLVANGVWLAALFLSTRVKTEPAILLCLIYALLFTSLIFAYAFPLDSLTGLAPVIRALVSMILLSLPLFFAGLIFSESLRLAGETAGPLASNLSGSVAGGILEYGSIRWGIKSLYAIAIVTYAGALLAFLVQRKR